MTARKAVTSSSERLLSVCFDFETDRDERRLLDGREDSRLDEESEPGIREFRGTSDGGLTRRGGLSFGL